MFLTASRKNQEYFIKTDRRTIRSSAFSLFLLFVDWTENRKNKIERSISPLSTFDEVIIFVARQALVRQSLSLGPSARLTVSSSISLMRLKRCLEVYEAVSMRFEANKVWVWINTIHVTGNAISRDYCCASVDGSKGGLTLWYWVGGTWVVISMTFSADFAIFTSCITW